MFFQRLWKCWLYGLGRTVVAALAAHSNSISLGLCQGYSAILVPQLRDPDSPLHISDEEGSWLAALGVISNPVGALLAGVLGEVLGRKAVIQLTSVPFLVGWICIALSSEMTMLGIGRFITGLGAGMVPASYVYVAEVSTPDYRSVLSACGPVLVSVGVLIVYSLGTAATWNIVAALCAIFVILSLAVVSRVPESPPWLASCGRIPQARSALTWLRRSTAAADQELAELLATLNKDEAVSQTKEDPLNRPGSIERYIVYFKRPEVWKPFLILMAFFSFQEGSGIYVLLYYSVSLFQDVGTDTNEYLASIWLACMRLFMAALGAVAIQRINRTTLAAFSGVGMAIAMMIAGVYVHFYWEVELAERPLPWVPMVCFLVHVCVSMLGFLQLPWIMTGELFPLRVRGVMGGLVTSLGYLLIFSSVKTYPNLKETLGMDGLLWAFAATAACGAVFAHFLLPETRGRTLGEIESSFKGSPVCSGVTDSVENSTQLEAGLTPSKEPPSKEPPSKEQPIFSITVPSEELKGRLR